MTAEHAGFYSELFAALKHIMLVPLLDNPTPGSSGGTGDREQELSDDDWFSKAAAAAKAHSDTLGGQVKLWWAAVSCACASDVPR